MTSCYPQLSVIYQKLDIRDTQCLMVRHHDRQHDHIHIIFNRVNDHGKTISNSNQRYKSL
ncbi:MAG: relaxase/mobilization nuclease domain-containing protein [Alistipes putredinis]